MTVSLVTGGSGYFGSVLVRHLLARGDRVRVLDLADADDRPAEVDLVLGDVRRHDIARAAVDGCDRVFHNIAQVPLARDPLVLRTVNVDGTAVLLAAARDAGVDKVVHTSSSAVFGIPDELPVRATTAPRPIEDYGHAKLAAEWLCLDAARAGMDVSILRPRTIVGHGRLGIFGILFDWIADGADPIVLGHGDNRYQFVHADDLAAACIAAAGASGPTVCNIGGHEPDTMAATIGRLCEHAGTGARVRRLPEAPAALAMRTTAALGLTPFAAYHWRMYARSIWFDPSDAHASIGWTPERPTHDAIAESYDWFVSNRSRTRMTGASQHRRASAPGVLRLAKRASGVLPLADWSPHE